MFKVGAFFFSGILFFLLFLSIMPFPAPAKEVWEDQGLEWYYDNLTTEDRQKIRQAMDYAIPRQQVTEGLMKGYAVLLATDIASNVMGYDSSIHARNQNLTKAKELLTEVFGKRYEPPSFAAANATITNTPYFNMTLLAPTTSVARLPWVSLIALAFQDIGINTEIIWSNFYIITPRIFNDPIGVGFNYAHGGFDALFIHTKLTPNPDLSKRYSQTQFVPEGENYQWIANLELEEIINQSLTESDFIKRFTALKNFQIWFNEWVPKSIIHQDLDVFPQDPDWVGFDPYNYGRHPWVHNMTYIGTYFPAPITYTSIVPGDYVDFNPMVSNSWYDSVVTSNYHLSLSSRRGMDNLTHPVPQAATGWTSSMDGLVWTVNINTDLKFSNGDFLKVDDVKFSYDAAYNCPASTYVGKMTTWFNNADDIKILDEDTIEFTLTNLYPYVESAVFGIPILSKAQMESVGLANWKTHATNTGTTHLHGLGPYMMDVDYTNGPNGLPLSVKSIKNPYYTGIVVGHETTMVYGEYWINSSVGPENYFTIVVKDPDIAIDGLESGKYNLFDNNAIQNLERIETLDTSNWSKMVFYPDYSLQELGYNHYDPRWGLNPHDPRKMYSSDYPTVPIEGIFFPHRLLFGSLFVIAIIMLIYLLNRNRGKKN
jgi:ABC-type transport system substrate-binding protein